MTSDIKVKICGLRQAHHLRAAVRAGAGYVGFAFFAKSPRNISFLDARALAHEVPVGIAKVALTADANDAFLERLADAVPLDMLQLHGQETPARVAQIKDRFRLPDMKAVGLSDEGDLAALAEYGRVADQLLVDAKPANSAALPGGNGLTFDWRLIAQRRWPVPWMLAGGLTPQNVAQAIHLTGARQVDVSSGVETSPGVKDEGLITDFCAAARANR